MTDAPSWELPDQRSQERASFSPSGGSRVPPRAGVDGRSLSPQEGRLEWNPSQQHQMLSLPGHVLVPGMMTKRENLRGKERSSPRPATRTSSALPDIGDEDGKA